MLITSYILLKISKDKLCKLEKGKATHRICDINKRHKTTLTSSSSAIITENLQENSYRVTSQTRPGITYNITVDLSECKHKLKCHFCIACAHMYTCTCIDACINTTVCRHMHLVHMRKVPHQLCNQHDMDRSHKLEYSKKVTAPELATNSPTMPQFLERINKRAADLLSMCTVCKDTDVLQRIYQHLGEAMEELNNTRSASN